MHRCARPPWAPPPSPRGAAAAAPGGLGPASVQPGRGGRGQGCVGGIPAISVSQSPPSPYSWTRTPTSKLCAPKRRRDLAPPSKPASIILKVQHLQQQKNILEAGGASCCRGVGGARSTWPSCPERPPSLGRCWTCWTPRAAAAGAAGMRRGWCEAGLGGREDR